MDPANIAFSICIPVYNGRKWISETLASVRGQTHRNWEIIVVDDASPEPCRDLVEAFAATVAQRVIYHANPVNLMTPHTRDVAHGLARFDHIAPLDCDDLWLPSHLAEFAELFARDDEDLVFTGCDCFDEKTGAITMSFVPTPDLLPRLRLAFLECKFWLQPSSLAFHRRLFDRAGPWSQDIEVKRRELRGFREVGEDRNFFLRLIRAGVEPRWTGTTSTRYRQHPISQRARATNIPLARACLAHHYGVMPGLPIRPQRDNLAQLCANGAKSADEDSRHIRLSALYYFRAWRWRKVRMDRLARAAWAALRMLMRGKH